MGRLARARPPNVDLRLRPLARSGRGARESRKRYARSEAIAWPSQLGAVALAALLAPCAPLWRHKSRSPLLVSIIVFVFLPTTKLAGRSLLTRKPEWSKPSCCPTLFRFTSLKSARAAIGGLEFTNEMRGAI